MKKLIIALSLFFAMGIANPATAQNVNINVNVDKQPAWGPSGYDYAGFYYFPDINVYFDVNNSVFHYLSNSRWISNQYLPSRYSKHDLYSMYKVVMNDKQPWLKNKSHKKSYYSYKGNKTQQAIRNSDNSKYNNSKKNDSKKNDRSWVKTNNASSNSKEKSNNSSQSSKNKTSTNNKEKSNNSQNSKENNKTNKDSNKDNNKDKNSASNSRK